MEGVAMSTEIGQTSKAGPAAAYDPFGMWHLLFVSKDASNRLLYVTSTDGGLTWAIGPSTGQKTPTAPAIAVVTQPLPAGNPSNLLVAVFRANDPSNRLLYSVLDLDQPPDLRAWRFVGQVGRESARAVYAVGGTTDVTVFFLANDNTGRLLSAQFTP
jgi:hypothetical protein